MRRMHVEQEDVFYYITVMNENYEHPEMPVGAEADIIEQNDQHVRCTLRRSKGSIGGYAVSGSLASYVVRPSDGRSG